MLGDDLYTNDGESFTNGLYYPEVDETVEAAEQEQKSTQAASYPVMDDVADWFKEQIRLTDSAMYIKSYASAEHVSLEDAHRAFDIARVILEGKAVEFAEFGKEHQ